MHTNIPNLSLISPNTLRNMSKLQTPTPAKESMQSIGKGTLNKLAVTSQTYDSLTTLLWPQA